MLEIWEEGAPERHVQGVGGYTSRPYYDAAVEYVNICDAIYLCTTQTVLVTSTFERITYNFLYCI